MASEERLRAETAVRFFRWQINDVRAAVAAQRASSENFDAVGHRWLLLLQVDDSVSPNTVDLFLKFVGNAPQPIEVQFSIGVGPQSSAALTTTRSGRFNFRLDDRTSGSDFAAVTDFLDESKHWVKDNKTVVECVIVVRTYPHPPAERRCWALQDLLPEDSSDVSFSVEGELMESHAALVATRAPGLWHLVEQHRASHSSAEPVTVSNAKADVLRIVLK